MFFIFNRFWYRHAVRWISVWHLWRKEPVQSCWCNVCCNISYHGSNTIGIKTKEVNQSFYSVWTHLIQWAIPFEIHAPSVEEFGIPTKLNVLSHSGSTQFSENLCSRSRQNLWDNELIKPLNRISAGMRQKRVTFCGIQQEWHLMLKSSTVFQLELHTELTVIFLLDLTFNSTGISECNLLPQGVCWFQNGIAQYCFDSKHGTLNKIKT